MRNLTAKLFHASLIIVILGMPVITWGSYWNDNKICTGRFNDGICRMLTAPFAALVWPLYWSIKLQAIPSVKIDNAEMPSDEIIWHECINVIRNSDVYDDNLSIVDDCKGIIAHGTIGEKVEGK